MYLPPENSPWGRDATGFMSHVLSLIYTLCKFDAVYLVGDVNSRVGTKLDFIPNIDNVSNRKVVDNTSNKHGEVLLDFLLESKMCIVNGRVCPENDNFTCIHTTGSSVVDYVCTFHDNLENCKHFKVHLSRPLLTSLNIMEQKIPDHSVLEFDFAPNHIQSNINQVPSSDNINSVNSEWKSNIESDSGSDEMYFMHLSM